MKITKLLLISTLLSLFFSVYVFADSPIQLPRTGQAWSYEAGDDGYLQAGVAWPSPRFAENTSGTVMDKLTGLVWPRWPDTTEGDACPWHDITWQQSLDCMKYLNSTSYLGYSDWRLPNIIEFESLVDARGQNIFIWPDIKSYPYRLTNYYWSSSTYAVDTSSAWGVDMSDGRISAFNKAYGRYVWPVRDGQSGLSAMWKTGQAKCYGEKGEETLCADTGQDGDLQKGVAWPSIRFTSNGDETVTDNLTGLMWTENPNTPGPVSCVSSTTKIWRHALYYVGCLNATGYLGHNDWRLPNKKELFSLIDFSKYNPSIKTENLFVNAWSNYYWSSSTLLEGYLIRAWYADMNHGFLDAGYTSGSKSEYYYVWPVRGGQIELFDDGITPKTKDFGKVDVGNSSSYQIFTISHAQENTLLVELTGGDSAMFRVLGVTCSTVLTRSRGAGCNISVIFEPTSAGEKTTTLKISYRDYDAAGIEAALSGTGIQKFQLSVETLGTGSGSVTSDDGLLKCGSHDNKLQRPSVVIVMPPPQPPPALKFCFYEYDSNKEFVLTATPASDSIFIGWEDDCSGTGICSFTLNEYKSVSAIFIKKGLNCTYAISPQNKLFAAAGTTGNIKVTTKPDCYWSASSDSDWLDIKGSSGNKSGKINYSVEANTGTASRKGTITIAGKTFTVTQAGLPDLSGTLSSVTSTKAKNSKYYKFSGTLAVNNESEVKAAGVTAKVYLSTDDIYDSDDKFLGTITVGAVNAKASIIKSLGSFKTDDNPSGKYLIAIIDPNNIIKEATEVNNTAVSSMIVIP